MQRELARFVWESFRADCHSVRHVPPSKSWDLSKSASRSPRSVASASPWRMNGHLALDPRQRLPQPVEAATDVLRDDAVDLDVLDVAEGVCEVQPNKF